MTLKNMLETLRTVEHERVEIRGSDNNEILTCDTDSAILIQFYDCTVLEWFPHPAPFKQCDFTVILDTVILDTDPEITLYAEGKPYVTIKTSSVTLHGERREDAETD